MPYIDIPAHDGGTFKAYISYPQTSTTAPALIMIQEIFGINQEMRDKCDDMAAKGYVSICPDLFWRIEPDIELVDNIPKQLERAFELFGLFNVDLGIQDLQSTLNNIRALESTNEQVGCVGYCLGGKLAYMMATNTDINASVSYYGVGIEDMLDEARNIQNPLLMHIATQDEFVTPEAQTTIKQSLANNENIEIYSYNAQHAFARGQGIHYDEVSAKKANTRTEAFLEKLKLDNL